MPEIKSDFHLPSQIFIRQGIIGDIAKIVPRFGSRAILLTTAHDIELYGSTIEVMSRQLKDSGIGCIIYDEIPAPPDTESIDSAVAYLKKTKADLIIGFGSIDSINSAKAVSVLANNYIFCHDLMYNTTLTEKPMKFITIPGCPLFGFEIAPILYLDEIHDMTKKIYYNRLLYPEATIVDPLITHMNPAERVMKSTIASLAIASESVISKIDNDFINMYALKSIDLIFRNIPIVYREPQNSTPRGFLSTASIMVGIAFSVSFLSISLAISLALSSKSKLDIESSMGVMLPHIMEFNLTSSPGKYVQMSKVMGEDVKDITVIEAAIKAVEAIRKLETDIDIPQRLSSYDVPKAIFKDVAELAMTYPFLNNTPREVNVNEIETILIAAY
jgi:alcohol dehydrogenase class IV